MTSEMKFAPVLRISGAVQENAQLQVSVFGIQKMRAVMQPGQEGAQRAADKLCDQVGRHCRPGEFAGYGQAEGYRRD